MSAIQSLLVERTRQITLGFNRAHDAEHAHGEISRAALARLLVADYKGQRIGLCDCDLLVKLISPWDNGTPLLNQTRQRLLVEAGALILAELERTLPLPSPDVRPATAVCVGIGEFARATAFADRIADPTERLKVQELLGDFAAHLSNQAAAGIEEARAALAAQRIQQLTREEV